MIISNSAGPINQALDRGRSFARVFGGEKKVCSVPACAVEICDRSRKWCALARFVERRWTGLSYLRWSSQHLWDLYT